MHPLVADGGEMTVLRDLAAFSYGRWSVDWPESVPEDQRPELPDDRDFGYASKLKRDPGVFGRRFVRADVSITAQDFDEAGKPIPFSGESDVEETLDDAAKRTDGDVFFEREITRAGLGALVPRVDFDVDSVVPVLIWGKTIPAPVTSIEDVVESGAVVDYRVHVGGQLLQDDAARERANREVERTIAQERRERVKAVSKAQSTADSAKGTADSAQSTADEAKQKADETAALVDGLDIEGSIQRAREAVDSSNAILQLVRQLTGAAAAQGAQAQASASLAIEYARQAEEVLDKLDPLRDDVVAAHAEVARLSGEAAKAAQDAAAAVARGEKQVVAAQRAATAAAQDAATSQGLVDEAKALLSELSPLQDAARKSLADAQSLLDNAGGSGRSLADVLKEVAAKHQAVLSAHDDILATHGEVLEIHGEAIKYAAMAAAQAGAAAMQASQAAAEALRAADLNAQAIAALAEADEKLAEADRKLQEQIDVLEEAQRLLAQALRYVAAAAAQAAQAAMSAAQATEENANAIAQTNLAVDAAADAVQAMEKTTADADTTSKNAEKTANDASTTSKNAEKTANDARSAIESLRKAQEAYEDTQLVQGNAIRWQEVHRTRLYEFYKISQGRQTEDLLTFTPNSSGRYVTIDFTGRWAGSVQIMARCTDAFDNGSRVDFYNYNVGPNDRSILIKPESSAMGIAQIHVLIEQWWPNSPMEYVFVPESSGKWQNPPQDPGLASGFDTIQPGTSRHGGIVLYWIRGVGYTASRDVMVETSTGSKRRYTAGSALPAHSQQIGGRQVTVVYPVAGDMRPVRFVERL